MAGFDGCLPGDRNTTQAHIAPGDQHGQLLAQSSRQDARKVAAVLDMEQKFTLSAGHQKYAELSFICRNQEECALNESRMWFTPFVL